MSTVFMKRPDFNRSHLVKQHWWRKGRHVCVFGYALCESEIRWLHAIKDGSIGFSLGGDSGYITFDGKENKVEINRSSNETNRRN